MNLNELTCFPFFAFQISQMGVQDAQIINKLENKLLLSWLLLSSFFWFLYYSSFFWFLYYILTEIEKKTHHHTMISLSGTASGVYRSLRCKYLQIMLNLSFVMMSLKAVLNILLLFLQ